MIRLIIDGEKMINKKLAHQYLKWKLNRPDYHGENLDALWDILSTWDKEVEINLTNKNSLIENLGKYGESIINVFKDAECENENISFKIHEKTNR